MIVIFVCLFSEKFKEAVSVKSQSLQKLQDENNKLTQDLDSNHKGQSELMKVQHFTLLLSLFKRHQKFLIISYSSADQD